MIVVVVDQMRADYLSRFGHLFKDEDGFARLTSEGAWFQKAEIAHGVTMTSPGHATIATGSDPSAHGVIQNNWIDRASGEPAYAVADPEGRIIGPPGVDTTGIRGRSSAASRRSTIGSWLKSASPTSKVLSIAYKDRASILMAGTASDGAYWYEPEVGAYVTSSAFSQVLPPWVVDFDRSAALREARSPTMTWKRSLPLTAYDFVGADDVAAEGSGGGKNTTFPHRLVDPGDSTTAAFYRLGASPTSDGLSFDLLRRGLDALELGVDDAPDLLLLSLSGADLVGHAFGPDSHEIVDYYAQLDHQLGDLVRELDRRLPGAYALVLTADHGGARMPEVARARGHADAQRITGDVFDREVGAALARVSRRLKLPEPIAYSDVGEGIWLDLKILNTKAAESRGITAPKLRAEVAQELRALPFVADAFTYEELADPSQASASRQSWLRRYGLSFVADRSPDIQLLPPSGWLINTRATGTSHGTPYDYDTEVPIIVFGEGIPARIVDTPVYTHDVAPTVADLLGISARGEIDGRSLLPLLRPAAGD